MYIYINIIYKVVNILNYTPRCSLTRKIVITKIQMMKDVWKKLKNQPILNSYDASKI